MWGTVTPEAVVTVNGREARIRPLTDLNPDSPDDVWHWNTYASRTGGGMDFDLVEGSNDLVLLATFADGSGIAVTRTIIHDPDLERTTGYILAASPDTSTITVELIPLGYGEFGVEEQGEGEIVDLQVADPAIFILLTAYMPGWAGGDLEFYRGVTLDGLADLIAIVEAGGDLPDLWFRTIQGSEAATKSLIGIFLIFFSFFRAPRPVGFCPHRGSSS